MKYFLTLLAVLATVAFAYPHPVEQESLEGADTYFKVDADAGNIRKVRNFGYPYGGYGFPSYGGYGGGGGGGGGGGFSGSSSSAVSSSNSQSFGGGYGGGNGGGGYPYWG